MNDWMQHKPIFHHGETARPALYHMLKLYGPQPMAIQNIIDAHGWSAEAAISRGAAEVDAIDAAAYSIENALPVADLPTGAE